MSESLQKVWQQIEWYLNQGFSIIPVADRELNYRGRDYMPKQAIGKWTAYQLQIITKQALWQEMDDALTFAVAIVGGKVSGNLEILDIDVKYCPGIDAILFQDIKLLYPSLFSKLRIHKSPSGGYHILYRVKDGIVPGNLKLAGRNASEQEQAEDAAKGSKRPTKVKTFLETRGEGGYVVAPPSLGYAIVQDVPVPVISWEERCSLVALCESYSQIIKVDKPPKPTKTEEGIYDENPFEHFNNTCDPVQLMESFGWTVFKHNNRFIWFTRPGADKQGKKATVSASFNLGKRVYYIFTSSTQLEPSKGYLPATLLAELQFSGDKKRTFAYLVEKGYGRVKPKVEERMVKMTALKGGQLPNNFSEDAQQRLVVEQDQLKERYPYGVFWYEEDEIVRISRERFYQVAEMMGFRLHIDTICQISEYKVTKITDRCFYDRMKAYIREEDAKEYENICNAYEGFLQNAGKFTISRLALLNTDHFIRSTKQVSYKFFENCYLEITGSGITQKSYKDIGERKIWADQFTGRSFYQLDEAQYKKGVYYQFLDKAVGVEHHDKHVLKCMGYLSHDYKDEEMGYIIVLTEQCDDPKKGGGSGKNIFTAMLGHTTSLKNIPGSQVKYDEKFMNSWNFERILSISDVKKNFDFSFLKELSTGSGIWKKLFKDEVTLSPSQMPKLVISTNFSYEVSDGGLRRRILPIEFTDFFTKAGGVRVHFNCMFPSGFDKEEWLAYDNIIVDSIKLYLGNPHLTPPELTHSGWLKQFDQSFGRLTRQFIEEHFEYWTRIEKVKIEDFNNSYVTFCAENQVNPKYRLSSQIMNRALEEYCKKHGANYNPNFNTRENGIAMKMKHFQKKGNEDPF